jgi:NADH dehydrogenase/NADH:ubiquinone oxidoreductase subunit G
VKSDGYAVSDVSDLGPFFDNLSAPLCTHKEIRYAATILLIGGEPEEEQSFTAKQIRQAVKNGGAKLIVVNDTPIRLNSAASQFVHINPDSYDAFVSTFVGNGKHAEKMGVDAKEIDAIKSTIGETVGDLIIMVSGELSPDAQAALSGSAAGFGAENRRVLLHPLPRYNNSVGAHDMMPGRKSVAEAIKPAKAVLIGGSLQDASVLAGKDFVVVQELFETETTAFADVVLPAASFAEVDGTYTNNSGQVQRVRQALEPQNQAKADWVITSLIAREMGVDFGYNFAATAVFKAIADSTPAYEGLRYPNLKDESRPVQVKHAVSVADVSDRIQTLAENASKLPDAAEKISETPRVGHKLHRLTTMTSKTPQFHLLAAGNPKPESLFVSPLVQLNPDGSRRDSVAAAG